VLKFDSGRKNRRKISFESVVVSFENDFVTLTFIAFGLYYILYFEYSRVVKKKTDYNSGRKSESLCSA
jgi:hypothetical protein